MSGKPEIVKLASIHNVADFSCGVQVLDQFLKTRAGQNQRNDISQTYVAIAEEKIIGFYSLVVHQVEHADAPAKLIKGLPRYPVPAVLLARLGVDMNWQGRKVASGLVKHAIHTNRPNS